MKKTIIFVIVLMCLFSLTVNAQESADTSVEATDDATTTDTMDTSNTATGEIISPFYERSAERFTDGQIHYVNSECYFKLNSKDMGTGIHHIEVAIDNGPYQLYSTPFRLIEEGNRLLRYRAIDNSNNIEKAVLYQVYVDNTPPAPSIASDREIYEKGDYLYCSNRTKFYILAKDDENGAGIKQTYAGTTIDSMSGKGTGISSESNFFKVADGIEGVHEFYYTALDNVGNMSEIQKYNIIVDNTPPIIQIDKIEWMNMTAEGMILDQNLQVDQEAIIIVPDAQEQDKYFVNGNHTIAFRAIDPKIGVLDGSGVAAIYVKVNDEDFVQYKGPIQFQRSKNYTIMVKAEDNAGNISEVKEYKFVLDFDRPESDLTVIDSDGQQVDEEEGSIVAE